MKQLEDIQVTKSGDLILSKETYEAVATAARLKYNFRGSSARTIKKYVTKYLSEAFFEQIVAVPNFAMPKKKESGDA